jgi:hypothetical protein
MLGRTLRLTAQAKLLQDRRILPTATPEEVPPEVLEMLPEDGNLYRATKSDWQRKKIWEQAGRITWDQLHRAIDRLAVMDAGAKGWEFGVEDPELALEVFVASLCDSVRPEQRSGGDGRPRQFSRGRR